MRTTQTGLATAFAGFLVTAAGAADVSLRNLDPMLKNTSTLTALKQSQPGDRICIGSQRVPEIGAWVEGTVQSVDGKTVVLHGSTLPHATQYAKMMQDVCAETKGVEEAQLQAKVQEIQDRWLAKDEATAAPVTTFDFTFNRDDRLIKLESPEIVSTTAATGDTLGAPIASTSSISSLKAGDKIHLGYDPSSGTALLYFPCDELPNH